MAVESKPLFHPEVLRQQVRSFSLPEHAGHWQPKLQHWAGLIASGRADELTETTLLPDFLTDFFYRLLGYTGPAGSNAVGFRDLSNASAAPPSPPLEERAGERRPFARRHSNSTAVAPGPADAFTLSRERHVEVDGKVADAVLGRFQKNKEQFIAVVEGKGTRDPLDRPFAGRRMSAVDQAYRYAINLPCARKCSPVCSARTPPPQSRRVVIHQCPRRPEPLPLPGLARLGPFARDKRLAENTAFLD